MDHTAVGTQILTLTGLRFDANLGILDHEKTDPQPIQVDAELSLGVQPLAPRDDDIGHVLTICYENRKAAKGDLRTPEGRAAIERFFAEFCADELRGPPKVLYAAGHSFSDVAKKVVSIINLASVVELENATGAPVHPLRFRGNLHVSGWPAWHEFGLLDQEIAIGPNARLKVVKRIVRCAAAEVDPDTGIRDLLIAATIMKTYGHADCGVYAEVIEGGEKIGRAHV